MAPVEVAAGAASVEVAAGADQENASAEVAADADPAENQDPEADGWPDDNVSLAPTDPEAPPIWLNTTDADARQNYATEAERMAQVGATKAARVDAAAAYVDVAGLRA